MSFSQFRVHPTADVSGSVVPCIVGDHTLVKGNPARRYGNLWMCATRLIGEDGK